MTAIVTDYVVTVAIRVQVEGMTEDQAKGMVFGGISTALPVSARIVDVGVSAEQGRATKIISPH